MIAALDAAPWMLTRSDLHHTARIRAVAEYLGSRIEITPERQ